MEDNVYAVFIIAKPRTRLILAAAGPRTKPIDLGREPAGKGC